MTPQEIVEAAKCFVCPDDGIQNAMTLYLLNEIRVNGGGAEMTVQEIVDAAKCFTCIEDQNSAQTYLLNQILEA